MRDCCAGRVMGKVASEMEWRNQVLEGDALAMLGEMPDNYVDSIVTDPPSGISFMGLKWDSNKGGRDKWIAWLQEIAQEALRVIKPGGHALIWSLPRTSHWTAMAWENAGWETRDRIAFAFGTGFPKSLDVSKQLDKEAGAEREVVGLREDTIPDIRGNSSNGRGISGPANAQAQRLSVNITAPATQAAKQYEGWGTALKPAIEDWWLFRKPLSEKTIAANVLKWGVGGINVDGCRIDCGEDTTTRHNSSSSYMTHTIGCVQPKQAPYLTGSDKGRFPSHLIIDGSAEVEECFPESNGQQGYVGPEHGDRPTINAYGDYGPRPPTKPRNDTGSASRFFFAAKPSPSERGAYNNHATVKCLALMRYLTRLVTPPGGICLDMFAGSGTTGMACKHEGFQWILIEQDMNFCEIAGKRIKEEAVQRNAFAELARKRGMKNGTNRPFKKDDGDCRQGWSAGEPSNVRDGLEV